MRAPPRYRPTFRPSHGSNRLAGCERDRCPRERDGEDLADHRGAPGMAEEVSCSRVCTAVSPIVVATAVLAMYRSHSSPRPDPSSRRTGSRCTRTGPRSAGSGSGATVFGRRHRPKRSVTPGRDVWGTVQTAIRHSHRVDRPRRVARQDNGPVDAGDLRSRRTT
ncbi:hypothetical protein DSECCO2_333060 [anaerobic digester metagenome]